MVLSHKYICLHTQTNLAEWKTHRVRVIRIHVMWKPVSWVCKEWNVSAPRRRSSSSLEEDMCWCTEWCSPHARSSFCQAIQLPAVSRALRLHRVRREGVRWPINSLPPRRCTPTSSPPPLSQLTELNSSQLTALRIADSSIYMAVSPNLTLFISLSCLTLILHSEHGPYSCNGRF